MHVVCVTIHVKPEHVEEFVSATTENCRGTRKEPLNVRFDFSRMVDDPNRFFLYEVYRSAEGFKAHQQTPHYLKWKQTVADWMAKPRDGVKHESLFPADPDW